MDKNERAQDTVEIFLTQFLAVPEFGHNFLNISRFKYVGHIRECIQGMIERYYYSVSLYLTEMHLVSFHLTVEYVPALIRVIICCGRNGEQMISPNYARKQTDSLTNTRRRRMCCVA